MSEQHSKPAVPNLGTSLVVFAVSFTPDGEHIIAADNFGQVCTWDVNAKIITSSVSDEPCHPSDQSSVFHDSRGFKYQAHDNPIYSLAVASDLVATGADEQLRLWKFGRGGSSLEKLAEFTIPRHAGTRGALAPVAETNGLSMSPDAKQLFAASGDNNAYGWDIETETLTHTFVGHSDYLHCVQYLPRSNLVLTGSEDGTVKFWDTRSSQSCVSTLVATDDSLTGTDARVTCLAVDEDENWLFFGGHQGDRAIASTCHMSSRVITTRNCAPSCSSVQAMTVVGDSLVVTGDSHLVQYYSKDLSTEVVQIPSSSTSLFGVCSTTNATGNSLLATSGSSSYIDIYTDLRSLAYTYDSLSLRE